MGALKNLPTEIRQRILHKVLTSDFSSGHHTETIDLQQQYNDLRLVNSTFFHDVNYPMMMLIPRIIKATCQARREMQEELTRIVGEANLKNFLMRVKAQSPGSLRQLRRSTAPNSGSSFWQGFRAMVRGERERWFLEGLEDKATSVWCVHHRFMMGCPRCMRRGGV